MVARRLIFWFFLLAPTGAASAFASTPPPDSLVTLPVFEVRAARIDPQQLLDGRIGAATVLDQSSWSIGLHNAGSTLARAAGISVREQGGVGSFSTVGVRGSTASQVPIYLDGVLLNSPAHGAVNLADIPLVALDRIEVYRGAAPLVQGGASLGGAIHLHSSRDRVSWLTAEAGSHDTRSLQLGGMTQRGAWRLSARAQGIQSDNDWSFLDDNGTLYNSQDDAMARRINNDARGGSVLVSAQRPWNDWMLRLTETLDGREQGAPGLSVFQSDVARDRTLSHQFTASLQRPAGRVRSLTAYHRYDRQSFYDPEGHLTRIFSDRDDAVHAGGVAVTGAWSDTTTPWWRAEARASRLQSEDRLQDVPEGEPQTRWVVAGAVQPSWHAWNRRLLVSPGVRVEFHQDRFHGVPALSSLPQGPVDTDRTWAPMLQLGARWRLGPETVIKSSLTHTTRPPTLLERFGVRGAVAGNPDLRPEKSVGRDVSFIWSRPSQGRRVAVSLFDNDMWDLIHYTPVSGAHSRASNLGRASSRGVEVEMALGGLGPLHFRNDWTYLATEDRTDDKVAGGAPLPGRPRFESRTELSLRSRHGALTYELTGVGQNYLGTGRQNRIPGRTLHAVHARWEIGYVTLAGGIRNLADTASFDLLGYPLPGRTVYLSLATGLRRASR